MSARQLSNGTGGVSVTLDTTKLDAVVKALATLDTAGVDVGYFDPSPVDGGANVPTIAAIAEYGSKDAPSRPFLRNAIAAADAKLREVAKREVDKVVEGGKPADGVVRALGSTLALEIQHQLDTTASWAAANAPSTVKAKGGSKPLYAGHGSLREGVEIALTHAGARGRTEKPNHGE